MTLLEFRLFSSYVVLFRFPFIFSLPLCLVIAEEPILARWDPEVNQWRTSGIELEEFKEDENLIVLRTSVFGTMAIFQDFHINMPFQAWELRPLPFRQSKTVTGAQSVSAATNDYTLGFGETVPMANVFSAPAYRSHTGARSTQVTTDQTKEANPITEQRLYEQMALLSPAFAFGWSRWNAECLDRNTIIVTAVEHVDQDHSVDETNASGLEGTATEPSKDPPPNEIADQVMILGPVPTLGLSDEAYLSELPDTNQCVLTITGGLTELRLHILGERIAVLPSLPQPGDFSDVGGDNTAEADAVQDVPNYHKHELTHLHGRWFTPDELITVLQLSGDTWRVYAMTRKKVTRLNMKEYDEAFDPTVDKKQSFHADFFHMFMDIGSEEAKRRVRKIDLKYFKTVKQMLQATRLAVFS
ncbi:hypothetical protein AHF37_00233 [Paragonimus kellicotti]|nr:hypothetical protein AHF37_00233 [Paragonimus kellicotti]